LQNEKGGKAESEQQAKTRAKTDGNLKIPKTPAMNAMP
jgi:hypothetical protein